MNDRRCKSVVASQKTLPRGEKKSIMNLHDLIAEPIYDLIDFYPGICAQHGENASYFGVTLLDEPEKFVKGQNNLF